MTSAGRQTYLRPAQASDDAFLYDVFCTTWADEVAALPNQNLAQHVLRIQHIAQERRFAQQYPDHQRYVVVEDGEPAGRLYLYHDETTTHVVDVTMLPRFRSHGLGARVFADLFAQCAEQGRTVSLRVSRRNRRAVELCNRLGFTLTAVDDLENHFRWAPRAAAPEPDARERPAATRSHHRAR
jgi:GNAT superfamily N-acetyltransferase